MSALASERFYERHADLCRVFSNAKRLQLLDLLKNGQEYSVSELESRSGIPQSTISQHLKVMRTQEIVTRRKEGVKSYYSITDERFVEGMDMIREVLKEQDEVEPQPVRSMVDGAVKNA